ncbi:restriction endonuclease subunit S [Photobacterium toruni]|uniref:Restriction endonuclease subunit S n=1 Tax=Photobacterium toruni TaxID=1935446 RepID=A0ABU6L3X9_9GAMM|nr:restriction endonuclease subunit S [Photobacterium toruni]
MSELPKGWSIATFDDVIYSITNGLNGKQNKDGNGIPVSRIESIASQVVDMSRIGYLNEYDDETLEKYRLQQGDVLFSHINSPAHIGKTAICEDGIALYHGVNLLRIVLNGTIEPQLFNYYCKFIRARGDFSSNAQHAVNQSSLNQKKIKLFEIVLPAKQEQTRIANKLDSILAKVDKAQARLNKIPAILKRFRQSVLAAATSGELTKEWREVNGVNRSTWSSVRLDEVCHSVSDGDHQAPPKADSGVPFLVISNVSRGSIDFEKVSRWVPNEYFEQLKEIRTPQRGDILYTVTGSYGIPVKVETDKKFCFQRHIAIIKANVEVIDRGFLFVFLSSPLAFEQATKLSTGTAQKTLPLRGLRGFSLESPSLEEQKEIAKNVQCLFSKANKVEKQYLDAKARLDRLTQSILAKAFRGELVPQDPNDEPAEQLLERILKERLSQQQKADKPKKTTKKRATKAKVEDKG